MSNLKNVIGLNGIEFVEFSSAEPQKLEKLFFEFGFSKTKSNGTVHYFNQNDIHFLVNQTPNSFAETFHKNHGPSISSMAWRFNNPEQAYQLALSRGAKAATQGDYRYFNGTPVLAIYGIGNSLVYFVSDAPDDEFYQKLGFKNLEKPVLVESKGFLAVDHLTNNVGKGEMAEWSDFYKNIFGFEEVRYFDIRGAKTGLKSYALKSPCEKFCIPINEGTEAKSQINEYLIEYKGPGVQHLAFTTKDMLASLKALEGSSIETLDIDNEYYEDVFTRIPNVTENHQELQDYDVLIDGDEEGYLLQIFTKNIIGPIFIEIIQRKNHYSFGEGNFGALFRSIERDQEKRGFLK